MKLDWRLVLVLILSLGLMISCEDTDDDDDDFDAYAELTGHMDEMGYDANEVIADWIISAAAVNDAGAETYLVIDIRGADDYNAGHIPGAVNSALADVITTADANYSPTTHSSGILVACYTGNSAGHAVMALRLSGYDNARVLLFGMSSWNSTLAVWDTKTGDIAIDSENWTTDATAAGSYDAATISTDLEDGAAILAERVEYMLSEFSKVTGAEVLAAPANYQIINFWPLEDAGVNPYEYYGHFVGAVQGPPGTITIANDGLSVLDPASINVIYCWTGQTSSMMTAWLKVVGYNAKSLAFGVNGLIYSNLEAHKWSDGAKNDFDLEVSE